MKRYTHDHGIVISGTGVRNDFAVADKAVRAEGVRLTMEWIEVATRLGAPVIRVFAGPQAPFKDWQTASGNAKREEVEKWMADDLRACAEHGEKFGVIVAVQNHGDFLNTGPEHLSLLQRVAHPWCGPLVDTGKYLTDDPYADIAMMVPHAVNWQIKETLGSSLKSPPTDFKKLAKIIHDGGYRGYRGLWFYIPVGSGPRKEPTAERGGLCRAATSEAPLPGPPCRPTCGSGCIARLGDLPDACRSWESASRAGVCTLLVPGRHSRARQTAKPIRRSAAP
jgi:sugar phosphate isomerase/epimerase